ncbi:homoserine/Threonine efflux protein [Phaeobacter sp. CECT 5382]|uniref:LysE family transporter n=1 Tax=Phaeobacter sp. CECT 5382 TaxID=1712645 RepID=UPI0006D95D5A|nr:LysE family transporter [Phaeobacter sp. CECT 5382]CUH87740.1 homoserine/Threonine efflux protein [Phaeobacter sp. CECT 5382]
MIDPLSLLAFVPAALALNLTPGADMMFCLGQGLRSGRRPAIAASAGISVGSMVHVVLAFGGFVINGLIGIFAGTAGRHLISSPAVAVWLGRISAGIFAGLALRLALLQKT